jgi:ABC-type oligopeptide transport system substrate-binding subunit
MPADELTVGILFPIKSLYLDQNSDFQNLEALKLIYQTPFEANESSTAAPTPVIFENQLEFEKRGSGPGETVLSGVVRKGILFSDGTTLTPLHVVDSLTHTRLVTEQADVDLYGDKVRFKLKRLDPLFSLVLTNLITAIKPHQGKCAIGSGPYMPAPGQLVGVNESRFVRNPHYSGEVNIPEVRFKVYPLDQEGQPTALVEAVENGEVDLTTCLTAEYAQNARNAIKQVKPGTSTATLFFNVSRPPLDDISLRKAISLVIDRKQLSRLFYESAVGLTANSLLPPMIGQMPPDMMFPNIEQAKSLISDNNIRVSQPLKLISVPGPRPYLPNPEKAARYIKTQLEAVLGLKVDIYQSRDFQDYYRYTSSSNYHLLLGGFIADTPNPADFLEAHLSSEYIANTTHSALSKSNLSRLSSDEMDAAIEELRIQPTTGTRLRAVSDILKREIPLMPLLHGPFVLVHSRDLTGFPPNFDSSFALNKLKWKSGARRSRQTLAAGLRGE